MADATGTVADRDFDRFAGACAIVTGLGGVAYSVSFLVFVAVGGRTASGVSALFLLLGGVLSTAVLVALYRRLRESGSSLALWALLLGVMGSAGAAIHGGFNLATAIHPRTGGGGIRNLPNPIDPRGLLTFGVTAVAVFVFSWLIVRGGRLPRRLGQLGYVSAALLLVLYVARLFILNAKNPALLAVAAVAGFVVNPAWYVWLGLELRRGEATGVAPRS